MTFVSTDPDRFPHEAVDDANANAEKMRAELKLSVPKTPASFGIDTIVRVVEVPSSDISKTQRIGENPEN